MTAIRSSSISRLRCAPCSGARRGADRRQLPRHRPDPLAEGRERRARALALRCLRQRRLAARELVPLAFPCACSAAAAGIAGRGSIRAISPSSWRRRRSGWWRWPRIRWPLGVVTALLGWWLLLTAMLDLEHQWLPDRLTLPLIPLGLPPAGPASARRSPSARSAPRSAGRRWSLIALLYRRLRRPRGDGRGRSQAARRARRLGRRLVSARRSCSARGYSGLARCC